MGYIRKEQGTSAGSVMYVEREGTYKGYGYEIALSIDGIRMAAVEIPDDGPLKGLHVNTPIPEALMPLWKQREKEGPGRRGLRIAMNADTENPSIGLLPNIHGGVPFSGRALQGLLADKDVFIIVASTPEDYVDVEALRSYGEDMSPFDTPEAIEKRARVAEMCETLLGVMNEKGMNNAELSIEPGVKDADYMENEAKLLIDDMELWREILSAAEAKKEAAAI